MERSELDIVRRAFAKQVMAAAGADHAGVEARFAAARREEFLGPGPWKILRWGRGYLPTPTYSAHWIRDPGFARAVADFVTRERAVLENEMEQLEQELSPFKRETE